MSVLVPIFCFDALLHLDAPAHGRYCPPIRRPPQLYFSGLITPPKQAKIKKFGDDRFSSERSPTPKVKAPRCSSTTASQSIPSYFAPSVNNPFNRYQVGLPFVRCTSDSRWLPSQPLPAPPSRNDQPTPLLDLRRAASTENPGSCADFAAWA